MLNPHPPLSSKPIPFVFVFSIIIGLIALRVRLAWLQFSLKFIVMNNSLLVAIATQYLLKTCTHEIPSVTQCHNISGVNVNLCSYQPSSLPMTAIHRDNFFPLPVVLDIVEIICTVWTERHTMIFPRSYFNVSHTMVQWNDFWLQYLSLIKKTRWNVNNRFSVNVTRAVTHVRYHTSEVFIVIKWIRFDIITVKAMFITSGSRNDIPLEIDV